MRLIFLCIVTGTSIAGVCEDLTPEKQQAYLDLLHDPGIRRSLEQSDVFVWDRETDTTSRMTDTPNHEGDPYLSDDGCWLLYCSEFLYKLDLKQMRFTRLTADHELSVSQGQWVPAQGGVSFIGNRSHYVGDDLLDYRPDIDIYTVGEDGKNLRRVTNTPAVDEIQYDWSPDGKELAFLVEESGDGPTIHTLYVQCLGNNQLPKKLVSFQYGATGMAWGADGVTIYCSEYVVEENIVRRCQLLSVNSENGEVKVVLEQCPRTWDVSPVDDSFLFVKEHKREYKEAIEEKFPNVFTLDGTRSDYPPRWSNNGKSVVYLKKTLSEGFVERIKIGKSPYKFRMAIISDDGELTVGIDDFDNQTPLVTEWKTGEEHDDSLRFRNISKAEAEKLLAEKSVADPLAENILTWYEE